MGVQSRHGRGSHPPDRGTVMAGVGDRPTITASVMAPQLLVTGRGFLPGCEVTVRLVDADQATSYLQHDADRCGNLAVTFPAPTLHGTLRVSATDSCPDPDDETGVRWTNTDTVTW